MDKRKDGRYFRGGIALIGKEEFCSQVRLCEEAMYRLAYSIMRNEDDAAEVVSEAIFRAYKNLNSFRNLASFKTWMLKIVHNTAVETVRKNSRSVLADDFSEESFGKHEEDTALKMTLREAVESLKNPYRTVVVLFYYENLSTAQIARITDASGAAVKQQLSRARKMLLELLKEDFAG